MIDVMLACVGGVVILLLHCVLDLYKRVEKLEAATKAQQKRSDG